MVHMMIGLLAMATTCMCVEIVSSNPSMVVAREGEELEIFCESSTPYQWCYWAHNTTEYPTTAYKGGGEVREDTVWGFQWRKTSTRCGLYMENISLEFRGSWKCHLADTDALTSASMRSVTVSLLWQDLCLT